MCCARSPHRTAWSASPSAALRAQRARRPSVFMWPIVRSIACADAGRAGSPGHPGAVLPAIRPRVLMPWTAEPRTKARLGVFPSGSPPAPAPRAAMPVIRGYPASSACQRPNLLVGSFATDTLCRNCSAPAPCPWRCSPPSGVAMQRVELALSFASAQQRSTRGDLRLDPLSEGRVCRCRESWRDVAHHSGRGIALSAAAGALRIPFEAAGHGHIRRPGPTDAAASPSIALPQGQSGLLREGDKRRLCLRVKSAHTGRMGDRLSPEYHRSCSTYHASHVRSLRDHPSLPRTRDCPLVSKATLRLLPDPLAPPL